MSNGIDAPTTAQYVAEARKLGEEAGRSAASWTTDGNSDRAERRRLLEMLRDGDPEAWDYLPQQPNLSGEWADEMTPRRLFDETTGLDAHLEATWSVDAYDALSGDLCDAFEDGVSEVFGPACEAELIAFLGIPTVAERASEALARSEVRTRGDGSTFVVFTTTAATDWVKDAVYAAHGDMLPDDYVFTACREALSAIAQAGEDADLDEVRAEFTDDVDVYTSDLIAWLASHLTRVGYCEEAGEDFGPFQTMDARLMAGQSHERGTIFDAIRQACEEVSGA